MSTGIAFRTTPAVETGTASPAPSRRWRVPAPALDWFVARAEQFVRNKSESKQETETGHHEPRGV